MTARASLAHRAVRDTSLRHRAWRVRGCVTNALACRKSTLAASDGTNPKQSGPAKRLLTATSRAAQHGVKLVKAEAPQGHQLTARPMPETVQNAHRIQPTQCSRR